MSISVLDIFSISIGPSSSHTAGPMRAAYAFVNQLVAKAELDKVKEIKIDLYGSLALTGRGHRTDKAILMGLEGEKPETVQAGNINVRVQKIVSEQKLLLAGKQTTGLTH